MDRSKHSSIVTVCAACKKILSDGSGPQPGQVLQEPPPAISHGLCIDCILRLYPEIADSIKKPLR